MANLTITKICSVSDCDRRSVALGFCDKHYRRQKNHGHPLSVKKFILKTCTITTCEKPHQAKGYCISHYRRFRLTGSPFAVKYGTPFIAFCIVHDCKTPPINHHGYCNKHYQRWRTHGDPSVCLNPRDLTPEQRFWNFVRKTDGCWLWNGPKSNGYGVITIDRKTIRAHRYSYFLANGVWPEPLCLHSCDNPPCVNPDHLRAGTDLENKQDMITRGRYKRKAV